MPHDWGIEGPFDARWASATGFLPAGGRAFLHSGGVYCNSEVWINGHFLGKRPSGFASFRYDLTPHLSPGGPHEHFEEWGEADLRDMILRDRNHPSVIMWSIGNEIDSPNDPYTHEILDRGASPQSYGLRHQSGHPHADRLGVIARRLADVVRSLDPTRPVTAGLASALMSNEAGFADALDVAGYNHQEGRYAEDHARYPRRVLYGSENGMRWEFWQAVADNPYVCGQFLWTGIDSLGEAGKWPARSNGAGLLDLAGGDHDSHEDHRAPARRAFQGRLLGYVQATEAVGTVTVRLSSPGLEGTAVVLRTLES